MQSRGVNAPGRTTVSGPVKMDGDIDGRSEEEREGDAGCVSRLIIYVASKDAPALCHTRKFRSSLLKKQKCVALFH